MERVMEYQKVNKDLEKLIAICLENLKGMTSYQNIKSLLPIRYKEFSINYEGKKIVFYNDDDCKDVLWTDTGYFSNFMLLRKIGQAFGITCDKTDILSLMKFKMKIELLLCSEGVRRNA